MTDVILALVRNPAFLLSFSMVTRRKNILSLENTYKAKSLVKTTHKELCVSGRSTDLKIKEVHTKPNNPAEVQVH